MNGLMPHDVRVLSVEAAPENFHARFSATAKTYHYHLWLSPVDCPFRQNFHFHIWTPVDRAHHVPDLAIKKACPLHLEA